MYLYYDDYKERMIVQYIGLLAFILINIVHSSMQLNKDDIFNGLISTETQAKNTTLYYGTELLGIFIFIKSKIR